MKAYTCLRVRDLAGIQFFFYQNNKEASKYAAKVGNFRSLVFVLKSLRLNDGKWYILYITLSDGDIGY